jgi:hypothetical protein
MYESGELAETLGVPESERAPAEPVASQPVAAGLTQIENRLS